MAIKYLNETNNTAYEMQPLSEASLEDLKRKIIVIIDKVEAFIDKLIIQVKEQSTNTKKYKEALIKNAASLNDIEIEVFEPTAQDADALNNINFDNISPEELIDRIQALTVLSTQLRDRIKPTTIGKAGGIGALLKKQDENLQNYLSSKKHCRDIKRSINSSRFNNVYKTVTYGAVMRMFNLYKYDLIKGCTLSYGLTNAAIKKAINKVNSIKESAIGYSIEDEFDAIMEARTYGLYEAETVDISDVDGVDIADTIKDSFEDWTGIIPDDTIGDVTEEPDSFIESDCTIYFPAGVDQADPYLAFIESAAMFESKLIKNKQQLKAELDRIENGPKGIQKLGDAALYALKSTAPSIGTVAAGVGATAVAGIPFTLPVAVGVVAASAAVNIIISCCTRIIRAPGSISDKKVQCDRILKSIDSSIKSWEAASDDKDSEKMISKLKSTKEKVKEIRAKLDKKSKGKALFYQNNFNTKGDYVG